MSSRDIDSTSENVLHDWAGEEAAVDEPEEPCCRRLGARQRRRGSGLGYGEHDH